MLHVLAHARLHFGLLNLPSVGFGPNLRRFGGVGLMLERPDLRLKIEPAKSWSARGPCAQRALAFAQHFAQRVRQEEGIADLPPRHLSIERAMPEHVGLGAGTQLGLAVARGLAASWGRTCDLSTLARRVGRGMRSGIGAHGFEQGGLLVEAGKRSEQELPPLVARLPFPEAWRLVLIVPDEPERGAGLHGAAEREAFAQLAEGSGERSGTDALCRLVLLGLLPALVERDVDAFGEALYEFNARVGDTFAPVQGGRYASPRIAEWIAFVRGQGVRGVGQSSWGPTVFAVAADEDRAAHLVLQLRQRFALADETELVTPACNWGAELAIDEHR